MNPPPRTAALGAHQLAAAVVALRDLLERHQTTINRLNVYPVPDGDTGTNMLLTVEAAVGEIGPLPEVGEDAMSEVCGAIAHGSLMGARGNSGVILCQVLRGLTRSLAAAGLRVEAPGLAGALVAAATAARAAVLRPVDGTILSVADAAADAARAVASEADLEELLDAARTAAVAALWATPEQLPVLADAGVVDAGGAGLVLLFDALLYAVAGRVAPEDLELPASVLDTLASARPAAGPPPSGAEGGSGLRYEVMYLLSAADELIPAFKEVWAGVGDSIVVVGGDGLWNCHIHTDDIGAAIEAALDAGRPREIRVTDLLEQVEEEGWVRRAGADADDSPDELDRRPPPRTSVVAVASGDGVRRIFRSLGVEAVVAGGQSMNPSTAQLLEAIAAVRGTDVVVLPNNANIRPVAEQAAAIATKQVVVVSTPGIPEGFAALLEYDPQATGDENATAMAAAAARVVSGEVTRAVRAAHSPAGAIAAGDYLGLSGAGVVAVAPTLVEATCALLAALIEPGHEIVTLIEGQGVTAAESRQVTEWLRTHHGEVAVERHPGGQPLYPFLVSIE
jgi:DAK2 domain fusion protein YloV